MSGSDERPVDAVTFDYWNTLCYEPDIDQRRELVADAFVPLFAEAGLSVERAVVCRAYDAARREYWDAWHANRQFTGDDAIRLVCDAVGGVEERPGLVEQLVAEFHRCSEVAEVLSIDGIGDVLGALRNRGIRVGIVCDVGLMPSMMLRRHLERHDLLRHFDHWSFSDEVGVYKPDRRIFEHALSGLGARQPERALHVGDRRRTDIAGAQAMGMRAVRFTAVYDDTDPDQGPSGDLVVSSYAEFLPALGL